MQGRKASGLVAGTCVERVERFETWFLLIESKVWLCSIVLLRRV